MKITASTIRREPGESLTDYQSALIQAAINDKLPALPALVDCYGPDDNSDGMALDITDWFNIASLQRILRDKANLKKREELWRKIRGGAVIVRTQWGVAVRCRQDDRLMAAACPDV